MKKKSIFEYPQPLRHLDRDLLAVGKRGDLIQVQQLLNQGAKIHTLQDTLLIQAGGNGNPDLDEASHR